jgi:hypothetical protein
LPRRKIDGEAAKPYIYEKSTHDTIKALRRPPGAAAPGEVGVGGGFS